MLIESTPSRQSSQTKINKLQEKDLKELVLSLDPNQLISLFRNLQIEAQMTSFKQFTKIGLKCSQCHIRFQNFQSKGYGRDQHEALINSLKIILESMISSSYRVQTIKKTLKYSSKFKQPLINYSHQSNLPSSNKKSLKKVQTIDNSFKNTKKHLQFDSILQHDKQNMSIRMNESSDSIHNQTNSKISKITNENLILGNFQKNKDKRRSSTVEITSQKEHSQVSNVQKCIHSGDSKKCIFQEIQKHSEEQIRSLNARIKLLEEQNSILKQLLLKDFKRKPQLGNKQTQQTEASFENDHPSQENE